MLGNSTRHASRRRMGARVCCLVLLLSIALAATAAASSSSSLQVLGAQKIKWLFDPVVVEIFLDLLAVEVVCPAQIQIFRKLRRGAILQAGGCTCPDPPDVAQAGGTTDLLLSLRSKNKIVPPKKRRKKNATQVTGTLRGFICSASVRAEFAGLVIKLRKRRGQDQLYKTVGFAAGSAEIEGVEGETFKAVWKGKGRFFGDVTGASPGASLSAALRRR